MKTTFIRSFILLSLAFIAIAGIFCIPSEDSPAWLLNLLASKAVGALAFYTMMCLVRHWAAKEREARS